MTIHVSADVESSLARLAVEEHTTVDQVAQRALEYFFQDWNDLQQAVADGRAALQRGELVDHEVAMAMMDDLIQHG